MRRIFNGGVYIGGTGSANLLDDYEEGTWTPTIDFTTISATMPCTKQMVSCSDWQNYRKVSDRTTVCKSKCWWVAL